MGTSFNIASCVVLASLLLFLNSKGQSRNVKVIDLPFNFIIRGNEFKTGKTYAFPATMDVMLLSEASIIDDIDKRAEVRSMAYFPSNQNPLEEVMPVITFDGTSAGSFIISKNQNSTASISISFNKFKIFTAMSGSVIIDAYDAGNRIIKGHFNAIGYIGLTDKGKLSKTDGYAVEGKFNVKLKTDN